MLLFVETVIPIKTGVTVHLMVSFVIDTFENMRARLTFFYSKLWRVHFHVFLTAPCFLPIMLSTVRSMVFGASGYIRSVYKH